MANKVWDNLIGKSIFVELKNKDIYNITISEVVDTGDGLIWIHGLDKLGKIVVFLTNEISELREK